MSSTADPVYALRRRQGPLTAELVQRPSEFGLGSLPHRLHPDSTTTSVCGFCGTGCSLRLHLKDGEAINLSANRAYPVNLGMACPKGWEALAPLNAPNRATTPLLRNAAGGFDPVSWESALEIFCTRMRATLEEHGPEAAAFLSTGQIPIEEMALLGALTKFGMGMVHGDGNTRQCMATAVTAYKESFGFDAPPYTYQDFEESDIIVLVGSNLCIAHPILWQRVMRNRRNPTIVVIDPRRTETAMAAHLHLALAPKSDLELFYGLTRLVIDRGGVDHAFVEGHTRDFEAYRRFLGAYNLARVQRSTGLPVDQLTRLADLVASGKRVSFWWTMGVNQSYEGTRVAQAMINLALMTRNIGRPGTGANSITGQCNAMGSRLFSNTTNLLGGHSFTNPQHRRKISTTLGLPEERIPRRNSLAFDQILQAAEDGSIKALWFVATNTAHSWPNQGRFERLREKLDFVVVQDMYADTRTARMADLILPAAGWGEKEGTFINSERRIAPIRKVRRAPGQALADFYIFKAIAHAWGCADLFHAWSSPEAVFRLLRELSRGQPCDFTGIESYAQLDAAGGVQWPCPSPHTPESVATERRLFEDGRFFHPDGRARFIYEEPQRAPEAPDAAYPCWLLTGRGSSAQWHTLTRSDASDVLRKLAPRSLYIEINEEDARRLGIASQDTVQVESRRGSLEGSAAVVTTVRPGQVFIPMHDARVNRLTLDTVDPYSREPNFKACAVRIQKISTSARS